MHALRIVVASALAAFAVVAAGAADAQSYPSRPVRMVVGFPPGGTTDVIARLVSAKLSDRLGQQVVVENRPGASGMIGADVVAKAQPDGYTLTLSSTTHSTFAALYANVPFDPVKDFEPIAFIATTPYVMVAHPSLGVRSIADLIKVAKARPGELTYAASTPGTAQHLAWERFKRATGTDLVYVSYRGTGALMPDLLGGRLNAAIDNVAVMTQYIKGGQLIGLAVTSPHRSPVLPEMPTMIESGLPGFQAIGWFGVFAPARTPQPIVRTLASQTVAVMTQPDMADRLLELGGEPATGGPDELRKLLASETEVWGRVIREAGIKLE
ncbi:MAG TPA: tripartite tricarboxylate transporter substrate binding protein [Alphaproteobacteria bacterium]